MDACAREQVPGFLGEKQIDPLAIRSWFAEDGKCCTSLASSRQAQQEEALPRTSLSRRGDGEPECRVCDRCIRALCLAELEQEFGHDTDHDSANDENESEGAGASLATSSPPVNSQPTLTQRGDVSADHTTSALLQLGHLECVGSRNGKQRERFGRQWREYWRDAHAFEGTSQSLPTIVPGLETVLRLEQMHFAVTVGCVNFTAYGVPQERKRALILATAPGWAEHSAAILPSPTHVISGGFTGIGNLGKFKDCKIVPRASTSVTSQILPTRTIHDAIARLPKPSPLSLVSMQQLTHRLASPSSHEPFSSMQGVVTGTPPLAPLNHVCIEPQGKQYKDLLAITCASSPGQALHDTLGETDMADAERQKLTRRVSGARRPLWDQACKTLICKLDRAGMAQYIHPEQPRLFSVREAAALQTFPESYLPHHPAAPRCPSRPTAILCFVSAVSSVLS